MRKTRDMMMHEMKVMSCIHSIEIEQLKNEVSRVWRIAKWKKVEPPALSP